MLRYFVPVVLSGLLMLSSGCTTNLELGPLEDAENRYFVDGADGSDDNSGLRAAPLATIQAGIDKVADTGGEVIVAGGTYRETVQLVSALDLRGSFDPADWTFDPENHRSIIRAPERRPLECVLGIEVASVLVQGFSITNEVDERPVPNQSFSIPVRLHDCVDVTIDNNVIFADTAAHRSGTFQPPSPGSDGNDGEDGQNARVCTSFASRQPGGAGGRGSAGDNGGNGGAGAGFTSGNRTPTAGQDGVGGATGGSAAREGFFAGPGRFGNDGNAGAHGEGGAGFGALNGADTVVPYLPAHGGDGADGEPGRGGGGGGGGLNSFGFCGGAGGGGGEGGAPGRGGFGAIGGEPCFGIMVTASEDILITGNTIIAQGGGNATDGGPGGGGSSGGVGGAGGNAPLGFVDSRRGGRGGEGGNGGRGGGGGGGGGGPSIGIVEDAATVGLSQRNNSFEIGPGGAHGRGSNLAQDGEPGIEADYFKLDQ